MKQAVCTYKRVILVLFFPELSGASVEEIDPHGITRPASARVFVHILALNKYAVPFAAVRVCDLFEKVSLVVHMVAFILLNVRVSDYYELAIRDVDQIPHLLKIAPIKTQLVKGKVHVVLGVAQIHPENIYGEAILFKFVIVLYHLPSRSVFPTRVMETEREKWRECLKACNCREAFVDTFRRARSD